MPRKKVDPIVADARKLDVSPVPASTLDVGQTSADESFTLLDALACALIGERIGTFNLDDSASCEALKNRMRNAYRRAVLMAEVRKEFV